MLPSLDPPGEARDDGHQLGRVHRFRHVKVEAGAETPDPVFREIERN
jgi:hypothetical protein